MSTDNVTGPPVLEPDEDEHALVGAYALDAVDARERSEFEVHLAGCPLCTADVPAFREVLATMAESTATAPPPGLIDRTVELSRGTPQEPRRRGLRGLLSFFRRRR